MVHPFYLHCLLPLFGGGTSSRPLRPSLVFQTSRSPPRVLDSSMVDSIEAKFKTAFFGWRRNGLPHNTANCTHVAKKHDAIHNHPIFSMESILGLPGNTVDCLLRTHFQNMAHPCIIGHQPKLAHTPHTHPPRRPKPCITSSIQSERGVTNWTSHPTHTAAWLSLHCPREESCDRNDKKTQAFIREEEGIRYKLNQAQP